MFKLSMAMSAILLASTSVSATSIYDYSFSSQVLKEIKPGLRSDTCKSFNKEVKAINKFIKDNKLPTTLLSTNLCTYIHVSEGQLENTLKFDKIWIYNNSNSWVDTLHEEVAVAREVELIVFSQPTATQYLYYSDANAVLEKQYYQLDTMQYFKGKGVLYNPFGAGLTAGVFNRSSNAIYANDVSCSGKETGTSCVPGGSGNSKYWILDKSSPQNSTDNTSVFQTETTSIGFSFDVSGEVSKEGPKAGVSAGFNFGYSTSNSRERKAVNVVSIKQSNDSGIKATWSLNPTTVATAPWMGAIGSPTSYAKSDEYFGASAYRDLDLSAKAQWRELVTESNCTPETNRDIKFTSDLYIERGAYDLEGSGTSARWDYSSDSVVEGKNISHSVTVRTQCQRDGQDNLVRVALSGILN
ncbi:hypothetical protein [Vibrio tasmaniensis]|uniref:hypothetical protein n=1 Tax=Vibrio tasmaniensis TaxID=212663 RepID=UPI00107EEA33|nr:hypothetical protein [Vibrio tasmaniensis]